MFFIINIIIIIIKNTMYKNYALQNKCKHIDANN